MKELEIHLKSFPGYFLLLVFINPELQTFLAGVRKQESLFI
jgi:hypothetical protein